MKRFQPTLHHSQVIMLAALCLAAILLSGCKGQPIPITAAPQSIATPAGAINDKGCITSENVPLRIGPGVNYSIANILKRGTYLQATGTSPDELWYQVKLISQSGVQYNPTTAGNTGWVSAVFIALASRGPAAALDCPEIAVQEAAAAANATPSPVEAITSAETVEATSTEVAAGIAVVAATETPASTATIKPTSPSITYYIANTPQPNDEPSRTSKKNPLINQTSTSAPAPAPTTAPTAETIQQPTPQPPVVADTPVPVPTEAPTNPPPPTDAPPAPPEPPTEAPPPTQAPPPDAPPPAPTEEQGKPVKPPKQPKHPKG